MHVSAHVLLPQAPGPHPTLYLLHGLGDDHTIWLRRTGIERYADAKNLAIIMPAVARSFYQDMAAGPRYWTYLSEELPALMRRFFPLSAARGDNFTAGLSMGGYGALRLALGCPEKFAAAAAFSGALDYTGRLRSAGKKGSRISLEEWQAVAGPKLRPNPDADLFHLASRIAKKKRPALYVSCGTEDDLLGDSRDFHAHLEKLAWPHRYAESPGGHDWEYWDAQIRQALDWLPLRK